MGICFVGLAKSCKFAENLQNEFLGMKYITLPTSEVRRLSFYLAMEEYVARHLDEPDCFFLWQVEPSVIFGRNQVLENEVNVDYCRTHGIKLYRRKSGGGCVYADMDNLMWSFITSEENVNFAFNRFINMVLLVLRKLGIEATGTSHKEGRSIVHSTMLYDTNMAHMVNAITPSREKLQKKGIESVRQRITLLKDYTSQSLDDVKTLIRETLCQDSRMLTPAEVAAVETLEQTYLKEEFIKILQ